MTAVPAIRSDCTVPVFLFYFFFLKVSFYHSIGSADDSDSFFIRQIHLSGSLFRQCRQAVPSLKADLTVLRLFCSCLSSFPAGYILQRSPDAAKTAVHSCHPFNHPFSRMAVNHRTAFPDQRSIHPRTAAQAYIVPSGHPLYSQYHVMTEGGVQCPAHKFYGIASTYSHPGQYGVVKLPQQYYGESYTIIFPDAKL